jgi:hypothetical protein
MPDVTGWDAGEWADNALSGYTTANGWGLISSGGTYGGYGISANIVQTISTATITGGVVRWYLQYIPLSGDGLVTLHANLTAF